MIPPDPSAKKKPPEGGFSDGNPVGLGVTGEAGQS